MTDTMQQKGPSRRQVLTGACAGYNGSIRWREGERLDGTGRDQVLAVEPSRRGPEAPPRHAPCSTRWATPQASGSAGP